jgi:hypothetical protein
VARKSVGGARTAVKCWRIGPELGATAMPKATRVQLSEGRCRHAMFKGSSMCWCFFEERAPAQVLERVPLDAQGVACICRACATAKPDADKP